MAATGTPRTRKPRAAKETTPVEPTPTERLAEQPATGLTPEILRELRRPFTAAAIRFKPQVVRDTQGMATFYIDARLAAERLNSIVGPEAWEDSYRVLFEDNAQAHASFQFPVECSLTVHGVTKVDVGVYQASKPDDKAMKSAYSDALKRAAVKFGVGAYLYGFPKLWAEVKIGKNGKAQGFTPAGEAKLRRGYEAALREIAERFGDPIDHGDLHDPETDPPVPDEGDTPAAAEDRPATQDDLAALAALAKTKGFTRDNFIATIKATRDQNGGNVPMSWVDGQTTALSKMPDADGGGEGNA